ncbi:Response regulator UvrY [Polaribacter huanghezhanensis]|uniref:response regulator n=1 Tax=Polaribacter huanghezhanensis TaxID=1354726 RepID=UPI0026483050|nr:response regulator [Polaribacter huanghezhanensis]WKD86412.1 Response regulator UvrY [Polaribacter huanghezhanensis]
MFQKVLIVDDHALTNDGVSLTLAALGINNIHKALYCDDAYLKVKRAEFDKQPFDLIITDLSFNKDHREREITSGEELVKKIRLENDRVSIIVYSQEDHFQIVRALIQKCGANGFVCKGRESNKELEKAIQAVYNGNLFLSRQVERALQQKEDIEITDYDIELVKQLSLGLLQDEISEYFKANNISPSSVSTIEKRLNKLKDQFSANNSIHLVTLMKDAKLI